MVKFAEELIATTTGKPLNFIQKVILQETLTKSQKTYAQLAQENNYSEAYIRQWVAPQLWIQLSKVLGEKVNKTNCYALLEQRFASAQIQDELTTRSNFSEMNILELPEGQLSLTSTFYVKREPMESICYQEILQPGALLRITGPRKIGKTSLLARILAQGQKQNYSIVRLNLHQAETEIFSSTKKFIFWLCANVTQQLGLEPKLNDYWDEMIGVLTSSTIYFRSYILTEVTQPIILAFDEIEQIFDYPTLARDFLALLRSWYEVSKDAIVWKSLRLIIVHAADLYIPSKTSQSPFNVGIAVELTKFNVNQTEDLLQRYSFQLSTSEFELLNNVTGGFPHLIQFSLYYSKRYRVPLEDILKNASTERGIFNRDLNYLLFRLQKDPRLLEGLQAALLSPVELETEVAFKLKSLGLIHLVQGKAYLSCELYQNYFVNYFRNSL